MSEPVDRKELEAGLRFGHVVEMGNAQRVAELSASLHALVESMIASGDLALEDFEQRRQRTLRREADKLGRGALVVIADVPDKYEVESPREIDCDARLPLCKARCCTFDMVLSAQDLDEGAVRWDYGQPYRVRRGDDGYCTHHESGQCGVYEQRPAMCRGYDCRKDERIWVDFDKRVAAP